MRELTHEDLEPNEVEIYRLGTHHGAKRAYTRAELEQIARDYDPKVHRAALVIDHSDYEPGDPRRGPNYGLAERLRVVKDSLVAKAVHVADDLKRLVREKRLHTLSPELYERFTATGRPYLRAISFVGADVPVVKNLLEPVFFSEGVHGGVWTVPLDHPVAAFAEGDSNPGEPAMTEEEKAAAAAAAKKAQDDAAAKVKADADAAAQAKADADAKLAADAEAARRKAVEDADKKAAEARDAAMKEALVGAGVEKFAEGIQKAVLAAVTPAVEAATKPLLEKFGAIERRLEAQDPHVGDTAIVKFAEGLVEKGLIEGKDRESVVATAKALRGVDIEVDGKKVSALDQYMERERNRKPAVPTGELPERKPELIAFAEGEVKTADGKGTHRLFVPPEATKDQAAEVKKIGKYAAEKKIPLGQAMQEVEELERQGVTVH